MQCEFTVELAQDDSSMLERDEYEEGIKEELIRYDLKMTYYIRG